MAEIMFVILFLISSVTFILFIWAMIKPGAKILKRVLPKLGGRKSFAKVLLPVWLVTIIGAGIVTPPLMPEITNLNIAKTQDVITETYKIEGEIKGEFLSFKINNEDPVIQGSKFSKEIKLSPGDNEVRIVVKVKEKDLEKELTNETYNIYFDYEGMLYADQLKKDQQAAEELNRKLSVVPRYEVVRKENLTDGFSAILYIDGKAEDYLVTNVIKDFKSKNNDKNISVMLFEKSNKEAAEKVLESEDISSLISLVRANYEKRDNSEQFFLFPAGLEGSKLAVEV